MERFDVTRRSAAALDVGDPVRAGAAGTDDDDFVNGLDVDDFTDLLRGDDFAVDDLVLIGDGLGAVSALTGHPFEAFRQNGRLFRLCAVLDDFFDFTGLISDALDHDFAAGLQRLGKTGFDHVVFSELDLLTLQEVAHRTGGIVHRKLLAIHHEIDLEAAEDVDLHILFEERVRVEVRGIGSLEIDPGFFDRIGDRAGRFDTLQDLALFIERDWDRTIDDDRVPIFRVGSDTERRIVDQVVFPDRDPGRRHNGFRVSRRSFHRDDLTVGKHIDGIGRRGITDHGGTADRDHEDGGCDPAREQADEFPVVL